MPNATKELSVFVDESGSFDSSCEPSRFYIISLVFHDQKDSIDPLLDEFDAQLRYLDVADMCLHAGPLIRREEEFRAFDIQLRRKLFGRMIGFARHAPVKCAAFVVDKKYCDSPDGMVDFFTQQIAAFLARHAEFCSDYDLIKVYYDNGQDQVKGILRNVMAPFNAAFVENVKPSNYRLFQVADLVCTVQLLKAKMDSGLTLNKSESYFFPSIRDLKKNVINPILRMIVQ